MMEGRAVIVVTGRHRPHQSLLLLYGGLIGVAALGRGESSVLADVLPPWMVLTWASVMIGAAVAGLAGAWIRSPWGMQLELGAMLSQAGATLIYAFVVTVGIRGWQGWISGGLLAAWTVANLWRAAQLWNDLHRIDRAGKS